MSKPFVPKAGTTAECAAFTGLENEVVLDEEKGSLIVHDGVTAGGAHEILPKAKNDELYEGKGVALPKTGGEMSGAIVSTNGEAIRGAHDYGNVTIRGGTAFKKGSQINTFGKDHPDKPGWLEIYASNEAVTKTAVFKPDGTFAWDGNSVITSAGGTVNGEFTVNMSGEDKSITFVDSAYASGTNPSEARHRYFRILDANANILGDVGTTVNTDGSVSTILRARKTSSDGTKDTSTLQLNVTAEGDNTVTFGGKHLVRSVNGTAADASGNVVVNSAPTWAQKSTKTGTGAWTITGCTVGKPLIILAKKAGQGSCTVKVYATKGVGYVDTRYSGDSGYSLGMSHGNCYIVIPTSTSVTIQVGSNEGSDLYAFN